MYTRTLLPGKGAPVEAGSRFSIWVSDFPAAFSETTEAYSLWKPSDPTSTSAFQEAWTIDLVLVLLVKLESPRIKVILISWWVRKTCYLDLLFIYHGFYCVPQGAHHLGCSLDHCRVLRAHRLCAAATVFEFGAPALVVSRFFLSS